MYHAMVMMYTYQCSIVTLKLMYNHTNLSQGTMQLEWYKCLHGISKTLSFLENSSWHTLHSVPKDYRLIPTEYGGVINLTCVFFTNTDSWETIYFVLFCWWRSIVPKLSQQLWNDIIQSARAPSIIPWTAVKSLIVFFPKPSQYNVKLNTSH